MKKRMYAMSMALSACLMLGAAVPTLAASVATENREADVTFQAATTGALSITSAAPDLTFGVRDIKLTDMFYAEASGGGLDIAVQDIRGTGAGWKLTAELGDFENSSHTLAGADVTFRAANITHLYGGGSAPAAVPGGSVVLTAGSPAEVMLLAAATEGIGETTMAWANSGGGESTTGTAASIELKVVGGTPLAGQYKADLTWTLVDAP